MQLTDDESNNDLRFWDVFFQCMAWSWFLANDMQFYVVSIVLLFFLTL